MSVDAFVASATEESKKLWYLKRIKLFAGLSFKEMRHLQRITRMETFEKGALVYLPGDLSDTVYLLKKGRVKISRVNEDGREALLTILEPGEIFGEVEAFSGDRRETLVQVLEKAMVCEIQRADFDQYLHRYPHVGGRVIKLMGVRLRTIESRVGELVFKSAPARLATILLNLSETMGEPREHGIRLQARLTHQNLANLIGTSRETVSIMLNQFSKRGLVIQDHRHIIILDKDQLAKVK
ncbi:MAG: Crp/Fnr family transcriptional regulator [Nitrospirae bacterium]|nr:Crp/Fnr family transcriptional regulator [Nitrospirota bacterium]MDA1303150.1 Crp/Fnr family transcriptional regulator [Nitrospirota bacterium]